MRWYILDQFLWVVILCCFLNGHLVFFAEPRSTWLAWYLVFSVELIEQSFARYWDVRYTITNCFHLFVELGSLYTQISMIQDKVEKLSKWAFVPVICFLTLERRLKYFRVFRYCKELALSFWLLLIFFGSRFDFAGCIFDSSWLMVFYISGWSAPFLRNWNKLGSFRCMICLLAILTWLLICIVPVLLVIWRITVVGTIVSVFVIAIVFVVLTFIVWVWLVSVIAFRVTILIVCHT